MCVHAPWIGLSEMEELPDASSNSSGNCSSAKLDITTDLYEDVSAFKRDLYSLQLDRISLGSAPINCSMERSHSTHAGSHVFKFETIFISATIVERHNGVRSQLPR